MEAMAAKVPVISTNTGGLPEVNLNGKTGFTSNVGDVQEMARNGIKLLTDDALHAKMSKAAYSRAEEFDIEKITPLYESLYERALEGIKAI